MGNWKSLPQHGKPKPNLSLIAEEFTEKNLRGQYDNYQGVKVGFDSAPRRCVRALAYVSCGSVGEGQLSIQKQCSSRRILQLLVVGRDPVATRLFGWIWNRKCGGHRSRTYTGRDRFESGSTFSDHLGLEQRHR
jgi:hypothetical protein